MSFACALAILCRQMRACWQATLLEANQSALTGGIVTCCTHIVKCGNELVAPFQVTAAAVTFPDIVFT